MLLANTDFKGPNPCIAPSKNKLIPLAKVVIFLFKGEVSSGFYTESRAVDQIIDMTSEHTQTWKLTGEDTMQWEKVTE